MGVLFLYFRSHYSRTPAINYYSFLILSVFIWVIVGGIGFLSTPSQLINYLNRLDYAVGIIIATFLFFFTLNFPYPKAISTSKIIYYVIYIINFIFISLILFSEIIITKGTEWQVPSRGFLFFLYFIYFIALWTWSYGNLFRTLKKVTGFQHRIVLILLIGISITSLVTLPLAFLPSFLDIIWSNFLLWLVYFTTVFWLGFTSYILFKKNI